MHVIARPKIYNFQEKYADAKEQLSAWLHEAEGATWTCPNDIKEKYHSADFPGNGRVIFDIKGTQYRLIVIVNYANAATNGTVFVRWFGTHAEYDKLNIMEV